MDKSKQPGITIGQILLERAQFGHRADFLSLPHSTPIADLPFTVQGEFGASPDGKRGIIRLRVRTEDDKNPVYLLDVTLAALVAITPGQENMTVKEYAATSGIAMLYPFVREVVASLTSRGRFGPIWLKPLNTMAQVAAKPRPAVRPVRAAVRR